MAAAAQQAPKRTQQTPRKPAQRSAGAGGQKGSALHNLPQAAGVAILIAMLVLSLFVGNFRALSGATPKDFLRQGDVRSIVEDRLDAARNAKTVALRAGLDELVIDPVENAIYAMEQANNARAVSRADQDLTAAVSQMVVAAADGLDAEGRTMLQAAADDFAEQGSFLRQEARNFNAQAKKAETLYEKLPTRFVLPEPDVYEGL